VTHKEFQEVALHLGAKLVFHTAPCAVFERGKAQVSVDLSAEDLAAMRPLDVINLLVDAAGKSYGQ
jgi:hypothetical protein